MRTIRVVIALACAAIAPDAQGQIQITEQLAITGTVESVAGGRVVVRDEAGVRHEVLVQRSAERGVALRDGRLLAFPADVRVIGVIDVTKIEPGQIVRVQTRLNSRGAATGEMATLTVVDAASAVIGVAWDAEAPRTVKDAAACTVTAPVTRASRRRLTLELPAGTPFKAKTLVALTLTADARAELSSRDLGHAEPGARAVQLDAAKLDTGDLVAKTLVIENHGETAVRDRGDAALENTYRGLSAEPPKEPRLVRSRHFAFLTDVSDREWAVIRDKLERMVANLERYFGRKGTGVVEGFIVRDLAAWPDGSLEEPMGVEKIRRGEGVCFNATLGPQRRATLYSCDSHGVIQHECVHGFCHLTFGSTGPTWLAEGVAELGNYWRDGDTSVEIDPGVMAFIRTTPRKRRLTEIAVPGREPAGTWQDYAWRWALCHLLANNPNYADRFRPLAIALMEEKPGASFEATYGPVARELSFEYDQFLETMGNGARVDLVAWPWKAKFRPLAAGATAKATVKAAAGWQATGILVDQQTRYDVEARGTWQLAPAAAPGSADGDRDGHGRLVAAVFQDFALTPAIPLGVKATFTAPAAGQLFLRCADDWTQLADNGGEIAVTVQRP
ncbi:MAG: hypothetical protein ACKOOF_05000 [Planctomycetaceae bacterium]